MIPRIRPGTVRAVTRIGARRLAPTTAAAFGIGALVAVVSPGSANASDLTCAAPPGLETLVVQDGNACGARIDEFSTALARALEGVAFARAYGGGAAYALAHGGGVAAGETVSGQVGSAAVGRDAVAIVSPDPGVVAFALSLEGGQAFVGTADEGVRCSAGAGIAVNLTTGRICVSDGSNFVRNP